MILDIEVSDYDFNVVIETADDADIEAIRRRIEGLLACEPSQIDITVLGSEYVGPKCTESGFIGHARAVVSDISTKDVNRSEEIVAEIQRAINA